MSRHGPLMPRAPDSERPARSPSTGEHTLRRSSMPYTVGLDWAQDDHAVCVIDEQAQVHLCCTVAHSASGLADLIHQLRGVADPAALPIAVERPSGLLIDTLVEAGFPVVPIHPNALKASRPRYSAAQGKSDPGDAFILADLLRTDGHRFRPLHPLSDDTRALRALAPQSRRPGGPARGPRQPAAGPARELLARGRGDLRRGRLPDRPRVPRPLPHPR